MKIHRNIDAASRPKIELWVEDVEVARLWAPTFGMRIGSAVIKTGGLAGVGTNEECRGRGYARQIVEHSTQYFTETGHDLAMLFGIPNFYHKFGYAPALPAVHFTLSLQEIEAAPALADAMVRSMQLEDFSAVLEIYNRQNANRTGTFLRPLETWNGFHRGTEWGCPLQSVVVTGSDGKIHGYYVVDDVQNECRIAEVGFNIYAQAGLMLSAIDEEARRRNSAEIKVYLPPDHPFTLFCRGFCGCKTEVTYYRNSDGMARIINLRSLFENLSGELTRRLSKSLLRNTTGVLQIDTDMGSLNISIDSGRVAVTDTDRHDWEAELPQQQLAQLVMGYRSVGEISGDENVTIESGCYELLDTLFPPGIPWLPTPDWF